MNRPSREQLEQLEQDCKRAAREACRLDAEGKLEEAMTMCESFGSLSQHSTLMHFTSSLWLHSSLRARSADALVVVI